MAYTTIRIDGDFKVDGAECKYYCSPSCHPAQVGPEWRYGCLHRAWHQNRIGDFCPIVKCKGIIENCEIPKGVLGRLIGGKKRSINNLTVKLMKANRELSELEIYKKLRG